MASPGATEDGALLKAILEESATEVVVFDADTLQILQANPAAAKNLNYRPKALQKQTPLDFLVPEDRQAFNALLALLRNGKKRRSALSVRCCRRDGTRYPVEARILYASERETPVFIWIANDVSQREATRQALAHSVSDMHAIVAHIPGMAFQIQRRQDGSRALRYVSEQSAQLLGIKAAALRSDPGRFFKLILEEDRPDYLARLAKAPGGHMSFNWEGRIRLKAWNDVKWVSIRVSQRKAGDSTIWDGIMLNTTQGKQAEAELVQSRAQLSALTAHVESVKEQERLNLAREVHDDLGGNLTAIKIVLSWLMEHLPPGEAALLRRTAYLDDVVDQTIEAAHRIASSLRPSVLDFGIVSAIDWQLKSFHRNTDIAFELKVPDEGVLLHPESAIAVFRIVQEALTNVAKHARATRVRVSLSLEEGDLLLRITDNGQGLQAPDDRNGKRSFGILGMSERAAALGGELTVQPAKRQGTQVSLRIPLRGHVPDAPK
ncbi:MAG: PAS domain S-box protein [Betaproteobacteria bacterium]|nr:PAS domain S-box protein [Betaproteobacteria bacterium]